VNVDLHIHSTFSDGSLTPQDIIAQARSLKLKAIAITDHDTLDGAMAIMGHDVPDDLHVLSGVEISSNPPEPFETSGSFHILGYGMRRDDPDLNAALQGIRKARNERNPKIITRLIQLGMDITLDEVYDESGGQVVGRPHMARVLIKKGYVSTVKEAFDRFLAKGKPAYVEKHKIDCAQALKVINQAGGIPVLAHPVSLGMGMETLEKLLLTMKRMGLKGLEVYYPDHGPEETRAYGMLAERMGLVMTGGSDFHGSFKSDIRMGSGKGALCVPFRVYQDIMAIIGNTSRCV